MKTGSLASLTLLALAACTQPDPSNTAAVLADARADGSTVDGAPPQERAGRDAHAASMEMATMTMTAAADDSTATRGYKQSMMRMMTGMPAYTGDADVDFNTQMRVHHLAAVDMAEVQLAHGRDARSKALARKIITDQRAEIAQIDAWLRARGR